MKLSTGIDKWILLLEFKFHHDFYVFILGISEKLTSSIVKLNWVLVLATIFFGMYDRSLY